MKTVVIAVLHQRDNGGYECRVPDFPGCVSSGRDLEEAVSMIEDAANFWACGIETDGRPQPTITPYQEVEHEDGDILQIVKVDTLEYSRQHDTRAVRKNVSLPAWMAYQVEQRGINCSQILQDALKQVLA
jgi:predicted RNase H-like HicB family nuclease